MKSELNFKPTTEPPMSGQDVLCITKLKNCPPQYFLCEYIGDDIHGVYLQNGTHDVTATVVLWSELPLMTGTLLKAVLNG
jgi:hypothetical protein